MLTLIQTSVGQIEFLYDASGNLLTKMVTYNGSGRVPPTTTDYVKGIEYVNHVISSIYHDEGRLVQVNGTWQSEYAIKDHLGNVRVTFTDGMNKGEPYMDWNTWQYIVPDNTGYDDGVVTQADPPFHKKGRNVVISSNVTTF